MRIFDKKHLMRQIVGAFFILFSSLAIATAQIQKITFKLLSEETIVEPKETIQRILIKRDKKLLTGHLLRVEKKVLLSLPDQPQLELPRKMDTIVSQDGRTVIQFGDELDLSHPTRTNLFWLNMKGEIVNQVVNYYAERSQISISDDGYTAIAGPLYRGRENIVVSLYSPSGKKIWEQTLGQDQRAAKVNVTSKGKNTLLVTTNKRNWLKNHQIQIFNSKGQLQSSIIDFNVIQKITIVDKGEHLFVQGYDNYGLVEISNGATLWIQHDKIRMISPYAAKISPQGDLLFLLLADYQGKPKATYRWKLVSIGITDGKEHASTWLPNEYPGTWNRVFEQITSDMIKILAGKKRITYSWTK